MHTGQEVTFEVLRIPPQGKREKCIVISASSLEGDEVSKNLLDEYILKIVMNLS